MKAHRKWTKKISEKSLKLDPELLDDTDINQVPVTPFLEEFQGHGKRLCCVGVSHAIGKNNSAIQKAFQAVNPQIAIVEGIPYEFGISPYEYAISLDEHTGNASEIAKVGVKKAYAERAYTIHCTKERNIPFRGVEPSHSEVFADMRKLGYTDKDMMAFSLLRRIVSMRERAELTAENFEQKATNYLQAGWQFPPSIPKNDRLTLDEFKAWYEEHNQTGKSFIDIDWADMNTPTAPAKAHFFQKMMADTVRIRDKYSVRNIEKILKENDRVLVVYGWKHIQDYRPVFKQGFSNEYAKAR